ncbi:homoserine dehydrogenase [Acetobacteraceae bacterium]|nr:homoserine dehydrogenase [Acetobacteraceae bacterium]
MSFFPNSSALSSSPPLRLGIAGLGTVGTGMLRLLSKNADLIKERTGRSVIVTAVSAKNPNKDRGISLKNLKWYPEASELADDPDIDIILELIGGRDGVALELIRKALNNKIPVITANKALIACHAQELFTLSGQTGTPILYEAAVAGAIPAIHLLRDAAAGDEILQIGGILNGTCNYILTEMEKTGRTFEDVLKEAQAKGYAEADPATDIEGIDAGHKLAILAGIAFHPIEFSSLSLTGISEIKAEDLLFAKKLGYKIRLLGLASNDKNQGQLQAWIQPCLIPNEAPLAQIEGPGNAVILKGKFSGPLMITGAGAGGDATASAVAADLMNLLQLWPALLTERENIAQDPHHFHRLLPFWGRQNLRKLPPVKSIEAASSCFYLRCIVTEGLGVMATIASILRDHQISLNQVLQEGTTSDGRVYIALITHETSTQQIKKAATEIHRLDYISVAPLVMKVEN